MQSATRIPNECMQRMVRVGRVETSQHDLLDVGPVVAVGIFEKHQVRLLSDINAAVAQLQTGRHMQPIGKNNLPVGSAIGVGILED